jgi:mannose-1-phosphate guanylyltransferase/mannose-6-phosphate isomerase
MKIVPIILSGGSGARLWPLSRSQYPKQYQALTSDNTMLQETILRLEGLKELSSPIIVCNKDHRFLVAEQCREINIYDPTILLEPVGRNTAPAIAVAALQVKKELVNAILLILPADHLIQDIEVFHDAINTAIKQAKKEKLVTFGIVPTEANTGYGYIKYSSDSGHDSFTVEKFIEKPDAHAAKMYLDQGMYLWNGGIFLFQVDVLLDELALYSPNLVKLAEVAINNSSKDLDFIRLEKNAFEQSPDISIDYALMEKSSNVVVVPLDAQWSDVGSWTALHDVSIQDNNGNTIQGDVLIEETTNTYINAGHHLVVATGVKDLIIIDTPNATLVLGKEYAQDVKNIVKKLKVDNRSEQFCHRKVFRPWGWYDSIESGENFQVKKLHVAPGCKLSLQKHHYRSEHWVVVSGVATATNGEKILNLAKGESTFIPQGVKHSLENETNEPLEIIEIQSGVYLGEDDIVRFEDVYGRLDDE